MLTLDLKQTQAQVFRQEMLWPSPNRKFDSVTNKFTTSWLEMKM